MSDNEGAKSAGINMRGKRAIKPLKKADAASSADEYEIIRNQTHNSYSRDENIVNTEEPWCVYAM